MKKFLHIALVLSLSLPLIQCSSDDSQTSGSLTVNGAEFKLGGSAYNIIKSRSETTIWLNIGENGGSSRVISVYAIHEPGSASGTYTLRNNQIESGIATPALYDADNQQIAGGSDDSQPTGTISIGDHGSNHYTVTFNDVTLDPGTNSETTITGSCDKTFKLAAGN